MLFLNVLFIVLRVVGCVLYSVVLECVLYSAVCCRMCSVKCCIL